MAFEDYSPSNRHLNGRAHVASWMIVGILFIVIAVATPIVNSSAENMRYAAAPAGEDCAV